MDCRPTALPGVMLIETDRFADHRGFFLETWNAKRYADFGIDETFVQDNLSLSYHGVLRGLHYQIKRPQGKLVYVVQGEVFDVAVDLRSNSPDFGRWIGVVLSQANRRQLYIPPGFAHGFCVLSETALFAYKCTSFYQPDDEGGIRWNDPELGIAWPLTTPLISSKDQAFPYLNNIDAADLPSGCEV